VNATLTLSLASSANFGSLAAGVAHDYETAIGATVSSSAGDAMLSVADPSATATGRLVNGSFALATPVQVAARNGANPNSPFAPLTSNSSPLTLLTYSGPVANDQVTIALKQPIGALEPLRTGSYSKTITFTLSTTTP
jgi:hypothetical protein